MATDVERELAAARATDLWRWRPEFVPQYCYYNHDCVEEKCEMICVQYMAAMHLGRVYVSLGPSRPGVEGEISRLTPLYGCPKTGRVHACGERCDRGEFETVCVLSGITLGEMRRDAWWREYPTEGSKNWKLNVRNVRVGSANADVRERLSMDRESFGRELTRMGDMIEFSRKRARLAGKAEAFDLAFAICMTVLSDERFAEAIRCNREHHRKIYEQAKRVATHLVQRRLPVDACTIMQALPAKSESAPVLIQSRSQQIEYVTRYAEHCLAFWHLIYTHADAGIRDMSFRDFCAASVSLFSKGHNVPNWRTGRNDWVVLPDRILNAFPINRWIERKIYDKTEDTKISSVMRRSEIRIKKAINDFVARRDKDSAYLRYADVPYASLGEEAFLNIKR